MFNFFKNKGLEVDAAVDGGLIPISEVNDDVFSTKMLGDGYAIKPISGDIHSPVEGDISTLFPTKHAIGIKTKEGLEILVHLGIDTVELNGAPFQMKIQKGDHVIAGQLLGTMDLKQVVDSGRDDSVIVVYTNMDLIESISPVQKGSVNSGDRVQTITFKKN
ncbi:PTS sugar transporter subunit IIA [Lactobacillus iners]|jgi:PTS system, glucose subfamily, IIA component|uniref:PTS sugar transporter subunit IIA n=1 Tax=Lactobacillus iners TaxID=147802 RepID=UPI0001E9A318|nr:PTS glucose transporter subunit IIA [Lactobacillus iners]EFQ50756.1 PTS system, glucose subfamily, IIA component [Lactobacillus iners LEAF 2062A-h1]EGC79993.1 glucose-specific phosphotransferase enzyme IIA component [Lactobacillus iners UPII 143-D]EGC80302.1 glucose-specific phosphotransferase enzyme IIA component [Lactobacillus iners UPII 60-B]MCT7670783.1 PTS glucose transporter subunit IIA [Lactobacillus iners]MCT7675226.1 PTS glucose transporter subunit IIA [Lactobacillus iners]